jgi:SAM-dependent methyltransferase
MLSDVPAECRRFYRLVEKYAMQAHCDGGFPYPIRERTKIAVLDVGSMPSFGNCEQTYIAVRELFDEDVYVGVDLSSGENVDVVCEPFSYPFRDCSFDIVLSNQVLEHVRKPWFWIPELYRLCKRGGVMIIATPWMFKLHRKPNDFWRVTYYGMRLIFEELGMIQIDTSQYGSWCYGAGRK